MGVYAPGGGDPDEYRVGPVALAGPEVNLPLRSSGVVESLGELDPPRIAHMIDEAGR